MLDIAFHAESCKPILEPSMSLKLQKQPESLGRGIFKQLSAIVHCFVDIDFLEILSFFQFLDLVVPQLFFIIYQMAVSLMYNVELCWQPHPQYLFHNPYCFYSGERYQLSSALFIYILFFLVFPSSKQY